LIFIPLSDDNPLRYVPYQYVTVGFIAVNVLVYSWQIAGFGPIAGASFALVPAELFQAGLFAPAYGRYDTLAVPEGWTLFTYMFFHADFLHISTNMLFLWVFGDNVEDAMGHLKYFCFYIVCGATGGFVYACMSPSSWQPLVGASGAVAGVIAAYLILHPRVRVWVLVFRLIPVRISALWILGIWIVAQAFMLVFSRGDQVAWAAHIGGIVAGTVLIAFLRRPALPLFDGGFRLMEDEGIVTGSGVPSAPSEIP